MGEQSPIFLAEIVYPCSFYEVSNHKQTLMETGFMLKKISVILTALWLSACSQNVELNKATPQKMKVQTVDKKSQKGLTTVYLCKDNKEVSVVHTKQKQKSKKTLSQVTVTYNDVTEKLTRVISERGRNYANIRWYWQERDDFSRLQTSVGEVLADRCVKKTNKLKAGK